jgi:hypothetical protein
MYSQSDFHPKNNLAKFGYILDIQVEKTKHDPSMFLATCWDLSYNFWQFGIYP